ncbi:hypothetical protein ACNKHK_21885 [Shigella flexneri]
MQLQGDGPLSLAVINGNNNQQMRGVARMQGDIPEDADLKTLVERLPGDHHYSGRRRALSGRGRSGK